MQQDVGLREYTYPRWELKRLSEKLPPNAVITRPPMRRSGGHALESECAGFWWSARLRAAPIFLRRVEMRRLPEYPGEPNSLSDEQAMDLARFAILLAASVLATLERGSPPRGDEGTAEEDPRRRRLCSRLRKIVGDSRVPTALQDLAEMVADGDLVAARRGSGGGVLEFEVMKLAGFDWIEAAIECCGLLRTDWSLAPLEESLGELVRIGFSGTPLGDEEAHGRLGTFLRERNTESCRSNLRAFCTESVSAAGTRLSRDALALAAVGLTVLPSLEAPGSGRRARERKDMELVLEAGGVRSDIRGLATLRFRATEPASGKSKAEYWRLFDQIVGRSKLVQQPPREPRPNTRASETLDLLRDAAPGQFIHVDRSDVHTLRNTWGHIIETPEQAKEAGRDVEPGQTGYRLIGPDEA